MRFLLQRTVSIATSIAEFTLNTTKLCWIPEV